jgi:heavy metal sensor kinase
VNLRSLRFRMTFWYAGLLAGSLVLFGVSVYLGLGHYLDHALRNSLTEQGWSIGEKTLNEVARRGESFVIRETSEDFAPEINGRFIRITRPDGSVMYESSPPRDGSFDPAQIPPARDARVQFFRHQPIPGGGRLLIHGLPFVISDGRSYLIETGVSDLPIESTLHGLLIIFALGMPLVVVVAIGKGYWLMRRALRPVDDVTRQAEHITSRNLSERLPVTKTGDEIERLSVSLNHMISRLEEAFEHINRFTADVSHELRTPLTILRGELEEIARQKMPPDQMEMIGSALEETERVTRIVDQLLEISRLDAGEGRIERTPQELTALVTSTAEQMRLLAEEKSISIRYKVSPGVEVKGDESRLRQVVANLLDNAIKYTPEGGWVEVRVAAEHSLGVLEVADNGVGIPVDALPHVFERFYRADKARSRCCGGAGLGLSIVKAICAAHGAAIQISTVEGKGSRFRVEFPLATGPNQKGEQRKQ